MINFAKNDEFLTIIITVPFIYFYLSNAIDLPNKELKKWKEQKGKGNKYEFNICGL